MVRREVLVREVALEAAGLGEAHEEVEQSCPIPFRVSPACRLPAKWLCHSCKTPRHSSLVFSREGLVRQ